MNSRRLERLQRQRQERLCVTMILLSYRECELFHLHGIREHESVHGGESS